MEFHHIYPKDKKNTWRDLRARNINYIIGKMKEENVQTLCKNCHSLKSLSNFDKFKDIILSNQISIANMENIDEFIYYEIKNNPKYRKESSRGSQHRARLKYRIKKWIKKRLIIDVLFKGICIGCEQVKTHNALSVLEFHHRNPNIKEFKWEHIAKYHLEEILSIIKNEDCVCLCKNCHALIHSKHFEQYSNEIFGESSSLISIINKKFDNLRNNITSFKFNN